MSSTDPRSPVADFLYQQQMKMTTTNPQTQMILPGHLLVELTSLDELCFPTSFSHRMKYTCITASPKHLAVGCTSGSVYLFPRYVSKLHRPSISNFPVQVIACKEGAVVALKICPNEKFIGVATNRGVVTVVSLGRSYAQVVQSVQLNPDASVSALCWTKDSGRLLAGDNMGKLYSVRVSHFKTTSYFKTANDLLATLDGPIVQIDHWDQLCLVSTWSKSVLINMATGKMTGIGRKLRMSPHGGCFLPPSSDKETGEPTIFCSRPNARLWEVDLSGNVYSTHHFAAAISLPASPIVTFRSDYQWPPKLPAPLQFYAIHVLKNDFLLCATQSHLFVIDPRKAKLWLVCDIGEEIVEFCCSNADVFILTREGNLRKFSFYTVEKAILKLHIKRELSLCSQLLHTYFNQSSRSVLDCNWPPELLNDVLAHAQTNETADVAMAIEMLANLYTTRKRDTLKAKNPSVAKLSSGIHKVMENSGYEDDFKFDSTSLIKSRQMSLDPSRSKSLFQLPNSCQMSNNFYQKLASQSAFGWQQQSGKVPPKRTRDDSETRVKVNRGHSTRLSSCNGYSDGAKEQLSNGVSDLHCMKLMTSSRSEGSLLELLNQEGTAPSASPEEETLSVLSSSSRSSIDNDNIFDETPTQPKEFPRVKEEVPRRETTPKCHRCQLHKSWQSVLTLNQLFENAIPISPYDYLEGGVPYSVKQWKELIITHNSLISSMKEPAGSLCPHCQYLFDHYLICSSVERPSLSLPLIKLVPTKQLFSSKETANLFIKKKPDKVLAPVPTEKPRMSDPMKKTTANGQSVKLDFSMYYNPAYHSTVSDPLAKEKSHWTWLRSVSLETLIAVAIRQVGLAETLSTLEDCDINLTSFTPQFCQFLVHQTTTTGSQALHKKGYLPNELLPSLFKDFHWDLDSFDLNEHNKQASVISMQSDCPCCTLPLSCRVSESQDLLLFFSKCGHAYHKVCYPEVVTTDVCVFCTGTSATGQSTYQPNQ